MGGRAKISFDHARGLPRARQAHFLVKIVKSFPPNGIIKVERGPKKGRKRMKEWGEVTFMKEWVKALDDTRILAPADLW